jgi:translation initiation factor IF-1
MQPAPVFQGVVEEALPQGLYRVVCENGTKVLAAIATEAKRTIVRVIPGDKVLIAISAFDPTRGKIRNKI